MGKYKNMKKNVIFILFLSFVLFSQCKKEIITKNGIGVSINDKNIEINEVVFAQEENGLRVYLMFKDELINIQINNRYIGSYSTSYDPDLFEEDNYSYVLYNLNGNIYRASSGSFEISKNSNNTYSGSFKFYFTLIDYEVECIFEQIKTTDIIPLIEGTYIGLANEPYSNDALSFHDYNSKVIIQNNKDTNNFIITSIDTSFQDWIYRDISAKYVISMKKDEQSEEIFVDRKIIVFGTYENNSLVVASVSISDTIVLSIFGSYFFRKE